MQQLVRLVIYMTVVYSKSMLFHLALLLNLIE